MKILRINRLTSNKTSAEVARRATFEVDELVVVVVVVVIVVVVDDDVVVIVVVDATTGVDDVEFEVVFAFFAAC